MGDVLQLLHVEKRFGSKMVLSGIDLTLAQGESAAIKGRNGSGKSTLLRLAAGMDIPSAGTVKPGIPTRQMGYVPDRFPPLRFSLNEYLTAMGRIRKMEAGRLRRRISELAEFAGLTADADRPVLHYSKGMLQKTAVLQALLDEPLLLLMDEPMSGLDQASRTELLAMLKRLHAEGMTMLFSTHEDRSVAELADRCYHLKEGRLVQTESLPPDKRGERAVVIEAEGLDAETLDSILEQCPLAERPAQEWLDTATGEQAGFRLATNRALSDRLLMELLRRGAAIRSVRSDEPAAPAQRGGGLSS
ncbi:ATP-binding cassette domain-containing protein [Gorillibacterium sp. sgz500922]|uniref:ATP-binding cassette domain-containing protein n=1 Tax=Gorillibacterium sp. sgz500922 TaxID=3446694 RepID=UPI003F680FDF